MPGIEDLGAAASVIQVIDFSTHFLRKAWQIYRSDSVESLVSDLQNSSTDLRRIQQELQSIPASSVSDRTIASSLEKCTVILKELLHSLEKVARDGRGRRRYVLSQTFKMFWNEEKLKDLEARLDSAKLDLVLHLIMNMRTTLRTTLDSQQLIAKQMITKMGEMSSDIKSLAESTTTSKDIPAGIGSLILDYLTWRLQEQNEIRSALLDGLITNIHTSQGQSDLAAPSTIELSQDTRQKLEQVFIHRLRYDNMKERESTIKEAYEGTLLWVFEDNRTASNPASNIRAWLESSDQLYWITGKAGSGKSTLMRYICQPVPPSVESGTQDDAEKAEARCEQYLKRWSGSEQKLTVASFYFWAIGERSQASQEGLFRTLLVQLLQAHPDVIPDVSPSRWESLCLFNEDARPFTENELRTMFRQAVVKISCRAKIALFIDGLDEFDGDCKVLVNLLKECVSYPIKLCVASRPWNEFSDAFRYNPSLRMEELTYHDIEKYVVAKFEESSQFQRLQQRNANFAYHLIKCIVQKASGVFIWVTVVVASLLCGMVDGNRIEDLERALDQLPTELEELYEKIVGGIKPQYLEHAAQLFKLMSSCTAPPSLMLFWYADEEKFMERALNGESVTSEAMERPERLEDMRRRLASRCRGLLEVHINNTTQSGIPELGGTVRYLHKTVSEFVSSPLGKQKLNQLLETEYDSNLRLTAASVAVARILETWRSVNRLDDLSLFKPYISSCLCYASRASSESRREIIQLMSQLKLVLSDETLVEWDSSRAIWCKTILDRPRFGTSLGRPPYRFFTELDREAHYLCMATQGLVLEYTMAKAQRGCLIIGERTWTPPVRRQLIHSAYQSLWGIPDGRALSLLSLPPLTDHRSHAMFEYLLNNGAKLNIEFDRILALEVKRATPWEEILAKAISVFGDGVGDEKENVSKCLRLMIDRGAKVKDYTVKNAFRLAHESRDCSRLSKPRLLQYLRGVGSATSGNYLGISEDRVYKALKNMKKNSSIGFRLD